MRKLPFVKGAVVAGVLAGVVCAAQAQGLKSCEALRGEIDAKLKAHKVTNHSLQIVDAKDVGSAQVVGSCEGGKRRITLQRK